jgi:hypothetical protein
MPSQSRVGTGARARPAAQYGRRGAAMAISASHQLLSDSWTAVVENLERAIGRFKTDRNAANNCEVVFFEIVGDEQLHCNVTHRHATKTIGGWAGPGHVREGFVHNRRFGATSRKHMIRHIRAMVFAAQV